MPHANSRPALGVTNAVYVRHAHEFLVAHQRGTEGLTGYLARIGFPVDNPRYDAHSAALGAAVSHIERLLEVIDDLAGGAG